MRCEDFESWLDEGMPERARAEGAPDHATRCARCAASLAAAREIETMIATPAIAAPAGFAGRVMSRVAAARVARLAPLAPWLETDPMPWWVRAAAEPPVVLAAAVAALVVWRADLLLGLALSAASWLTGALRDAPGRAADSIARASGPAAVAVADPAVQLGLMLALASLLAVASFPLYRWCERAAGAAGDVRVLARRA
jgi:hypothetical protein